MACGVTPFNTNDDADPRAVALRVTGMTEQTAWAVLTTRRHPGDPACETRAECSPIRNLMPRLT